jgi:hypothetical protein
MTKYAGFFSAYGGDTCIARMRSELKDVERRRAGIPEDEAALMDAIDLLEGFKARVQQELDVEAKVKSPDRYKVADLGRLLTHIESGGNAEEGIDHRLWELTQKPEIRRFNLAAPGIARLMRMLERRREQRKGR